ncbi:hypothetical protein PVAND_016859 [Polypedilum vanderplanki]|uniref:SprT-like domain-containing protein n=1 Tax=Polypedilum vanderplanki TaxID=319348 RepID=A0A9J6BGE2_POLVA|nr:hypothetical protein PVAND_016859 [Polypedilum vanderplanki]
MKILIAVGLTVRQYNYVLIAAANLLHDDEEERNYVLGTIAHELMHFAMYLIYDNDANPYKKDDIDGRNLFRNLTEDAKEKEEIESFWAYDENADDFHIELIARIPDILLNHKHNVTRINLMKKEFRTF